MTELQGNSTINKSCDLSTKEQFYILVLLSAKPRRSCVPWNVGEHAKKIESDVVHKGFVLNCTPFLIIQQVIYSYIHCKN